jgi:hypothetical protein
MFSRRQESASADATELCKALIILFSARWQVFNGLVIDKIRTYRTQTPYTFFGHKAFTAISYPGEGAKSQPTG